MAETSEDAAEELDWSDSEDGHVDDGEPFSNGHDSPPRVSEEGVGTGLVTDHPIKAEVLREVEACFRQADLDESVAGEPSTNVVVTRWFDVSYIDEREEQEPIRVNEP